MKMFVYFAILLICSGCAGFDTWDRTEKALFTVFVAEQVADTIQARQALKDPIYEELNPVVNTVGRD